MISIQGLKIAFDSLQLLNGVSFEVRKGEKVSLLGPGASGKSTIIKTLLGLIEPDAGQVRLMGCDMAHAPEDEKQEILKHIGMAWQQGALFDYMTVEQNLEFAMANMTDFSKEKMDQKIGKLLQTVKLPHTRKMFPYELSGGMQRRVGVARAICTEPDVAIFDEPTSGLDPVTSTIILKMIDELIPVDSENTVMVVTSSVEIAIRFADRLILVNDGKIVADGPWRELIVTGPEWVRHFLGVRLIGIDLGYARELGLPEAFIKQHW